MKTLAEKRQKYRESTARWIANNPQRHLENCRKYRAKNRARTNEWAKQWRQKHPEKALLRASKKRAARAGLTHTLTSEDITIPEQCPVLHIPLSMGEKIIHHGSPTIDRIDNTQGYTPENIIIVSWRANKLKSDATADELKLLANFYT